MSSFIKPINFSRMYLEQNRVSGTDGEKVKILVSEMKEATEVNHRQVMAPSPLKPIIDAGATDTKVAMVLDGMQRVSEDAMAPEGPRDPVIPALRKLNII